MITKFLITFLIGIIVLSGCVNQSSDVERMKTACIKACQDALNEGRNLDNGPCLLNPIPENTDWVCDVAHDPRQSVDNLPENQCSAYREEISHHFIEVDPNCNFIKSF